MFRKILIANRGEIAVRIMRTCRRLGVRTVAVHSEADATAKHVAEADQAFLLGEAPVAKSYLRVDRLLQALHETGAEALHPGYGLLSEDAALAEAVAAAGKVFIGPPPRALRTFGDKLEARRLAIQSGLQIPPGSSDSLSLADPAAAERAALAIGFPLLVKPAAGGGGIGMQIVKQPAELGPALASCANRGQAAFGNGAVYIEQYFERPRHIELQLLLDRQQRGGCLGARECSVQRRHQKIIEEAPPLGLFEGSAGLAKRAELERHALALLGSVDYSGVGTVEFLADQSGALYFLEVNARIQVEHPVTELVTGLDLVEWQLRVAAGESLPQSLFGSCGANGHAVEARLYAEDPARNFAPQPGVVEQLSWPEEQPGLRIDTALQAGDTITPHYDPLLAKIIAHGADRPSAIATLIGALSETRLRLRGPKGERKTNRELLIAILSSSRFQSGSYDTHLVDDLLAQALA